MKCQEGKEKGKEPEPKGAGSQIESGTPGQNLL